MGVVFAVAANSTVSYAIPTDQVSAVIADAEPSAPKRSATATVSDVETASSDGPRRASQADAAAVSDVWLRSRHASFPAIPLPVHSDEDVRGGSPRLCCRHARSGSPTWTMRSSRCWCSKTIGSISSTSTRIGPAAGSVRACSMWPRPAAGGSRPVGLPEQHRRAALLRAPRLHRGRDDRRRQRRGRPRRALPMAGHERVTDGPRGGRLSGTVWT